MMKNLPFSTKTEGRQKKGMFEDIPRNVWRPSPEYNIPPHSPRSAHSVPCSCIPVFIHTRPVIAQDKKKLSPGNIR